MDFQRASSSDWTPPVVGWFKLYSGFMAVLYLLCIVAGAAMFVMAPKLADHEMSEGEFKLSAILLLAIGLPLMAAYFAAIFFPRKTWAWVADLVLICVGFLSCCTLPFCIFLLIAWIKTETQGYFGVTKN